MVHVTAWVVAVVWSLVMRRWIDIRVVSVESRSRIHRTIVVIVERVWLLHELLELVWIEFGVVWHIVVAWSVAHLTVLRSKE